MLFVNKIYFSSPEQLYRLQGSQLEGIEQNFFYFFIFFCSEIMNHPLFRCLLNYSGDGDVQGAVQGQDDGPVAGGYQNGGWWI